MYIIFTCISFSTTSSKVDVGQSLCFSTFELLTWCIMYMYYCYCYCLLTLPVTKRYRLKSCNEKAMMWIGIQFEQKHLTIQCDRRSFKYYRNVPKLDQKRVDTSCNGPLLAQFWQTLNVITLRLGNQGCRKSTAILQTIFSHAFSFLLKNCCISIRIQ